MKRLLMSVLFLLVASPLFAKSFSELVGPVNVGEVSANQAIQLPYIVWGGEYPTFYANGGLSTKSGSLFQKHGLNFNMVPADDFIQQVRDYKSGKSPFLRGTMRMIGQAVEVTSNDPRTRVRILVQMSYSQGDHCVFKPSLKNLDDLRAKISRGEKVVAALQEGGPHVGMLDDLRKLINAKWSDFDIVWTKDLTASDNSPSMIFTKNNKVDICFVITPDMITLTGGLDKTGDANGADGNYPGAHVGLSTATMNKSITDVYACREDFYQKHRDVCEKFVAVYLKSCDEVRKMATLYEKNSKSSEGKEYYKLLEMIQGIYGPATLPSVETDAHGLFMDCDLACIDGNISFFNDKGNLQGFEKKSSAAVSMATELGYVNPANLKPVAGQSVIGSSDFDWHKIATIGDIKYREPKMTPKFDAELEVVPDSDLQENKIKSFTVKFAANEVDFDVDKYRTQFTQVVEDASLLGNARIVVRGHTDPALVLYHLVKAGQAKGDLKVSDGQYYFKGRRLDIEATKDLCSLVEKGEFEGVKEWEPRQKMADALQFSKLRAEKARDAIIAFAKAQGTNLDPSQIQIQGVGIREPLIARPRSKEDMAENRRVEFTVIKAQAEATDESVLDF